MLTHKLQIAASISRSNMGSFSESSDRGYSRDDSFEDPDYQPEHFPDIEGSTEPSDVEMVSKIVYNSPTYSF